MVAAVGLCTFSQAQTRDRISTSLYNGQMVTLRGNIHSLAKPEFDLGRAESSRLIEGLSLSFRPSAAQQKDLDNFLKELGDRSSPNYHKYLTPKQFGARFGMSQNDIDTVTAWLVSKGFSNIKVSNSRNQVSFDGTINQVEAAFAVEMHNYQVDGVTHLANAGAPSVPAALSESLLQVGHLNDFSPKPRAKVKSHFTSFVSGNHFLTPGDFATIYDLQPLYQAGFDGTGQKIAVIGQTSISQTDINNFRSAAGLSASTVTIQPVPAGSKLTQCSGDEGESDLDLEWAGGIAKKATIVFVSASVDTGKTCSTRTNSVWDALQYAVDNNVAPFISISYGFCESGLPAGFPATVQSWAQQGISQGQTIVSATGDAGAADCDTGTSATQGLAVDVPAAIPEVTGAGGNEFDGDLAGAVSGTAPNTTAGATQYWGASGNGSDVASTALSYIPEEAWNDTATDIANGGGLSASGGGASTIFAKPTWQTGTGVPPDNKRDVPDVSVTASADHDGYLVCSEDNTATPCASGFRDSAGGSLEVVGGTSASAPTMAAVLAILNQSFGAAPGVGLAPVNPSLYQFATSNPSVFHDVIKGDNKVPCTAPSPNCPTGTTSIGFSTGPGYDQVTGLGSVDANALAQVWSATIPSFSISAGTFNPTSVAAGGSSTATITVAPLNGFTESVNLSCPNLPSGVTCSWNPSSVAGGNGTAQLTLNTLPDLGASTTNVTVNGTSSSRLKSSGVSLDVTATTETFSLTSQPAVSTITVKQGQTSTAVNMVVTSTSAPSFVINNGQQTAVSVMYTCVGLPSESTCNFSPSNPTNAASVTLTIATTAPTAKMQRPLDEGVKVFYAVLLPGLFGLILTVPRLRRMTAVRVFTVVGLLAVSMLWMASCGGSNNSSGPTNPGTPVGSYSITVNAKTAGSGSAPISASPALSFTLTVTQ
jgi:subtilase family serine protease